MAQVAITTVLRFEIEYCYSCAIPFALPEQFQRDRRDDHKSFYCPNGHSQSYLAKTEAEKLRDELQRVQQEKSRVTQQLWTTQAERDKAERKAAKILKRAHAGVCQHCNRTFTDVARHMKTKHPEQK